MLEIVWVFTPIIPRAGGEKLEYRTGLSYYGSFSLLTNKRFVYNGYGYGKPEETRGIYYLLSFDLA